MRRAALALLLVALVALVAGCGGGGTTTVIERTVTEEVQAEEEKGGGEEAATEEAATEEAAKGEVEEAQGEAEPTRVVHLQTFRSPTGNIGCGMYDGGARCDIRERDWSPPPRPARCPKEVDFGQGLAVSAAGRASFVCAGDTALDPGAKALAYGTASQVGASECVSRTSGVTCTNSSGHGFFISVQSYRIF